MNNRYATTAQNARDWRGKENEASLTMPKASSKEEGDAIDVGIGKEFSTMRYFRRSN